MAQTLVQAAKLSNDVLQAGILELFVRKDPIFERLGYIDILGNGLTYNVETTEPTAQFYSVGDTWVEGTGTTTQHTSNLVILGGDVEIDNFLMATRSNINDLKAETIESKVKAVKHEFMDTFYYGHTTLDTKGFNGLHELIESGTAAYKNTHGIGTATTTEKLLLMSELEEAIDMVRVGEPELMVMSHLMRRYINTYLRGVGGITYDDAANGRIQTIFGIPVVVSHYVRDTENVLHEYATGEWGYDNDVTTTDTATSIFLLQFGPKAVQGLQQNPMSIEDLGPMETKDAHKYRIKWYCGLMLQNILTCAKVSGVDPDGTVAA